MMDTFASFDFTPFGRTPGAAMQTFMERNKLRSAARIFWPAPCCERGTGWVVGWNMNSMVCCVVCVVRGIRLDDLIDWLLDFEEEYIDKNRDGCGPLKDLKVLGEWHNRPSEDPHPDWYQQSTMSVRQHRLHADLWFCFRSLECDKKGQFFHFGQDDRRIPNMSCSAHCCGYWWKDTNFILINFDPHDFQRQPHVKPRSDFVEELISEAQGIQSPSPPDFVLSSNCSAVEADMAMEYIIHCLNWAGPLSIDLEAHLKKSCEDKYRKDRKVEDVTCAIVEQRQSSPFVNGLTNLCTLLEPSARIVEYVFGTTFYGLSGTYSPPTPIAKRSAKKGKRGSLMIEPVVRNGEQIVEKMASGTRWFLNHGFQTLKWEQWNFTWHSQRKMSSFLAAHMLKESLQSQSHEVDVYHGLFYKRSAMSYASWLVREVCDIVLGWLGVVLVYLHRETIRRFMIEVLFHSSTQTVSSYLKWLEGWPAGFKTNRPLNEALYSSMSLAMRVWIKMGNLLTPHCEVGVWVLCVIGVFGLSLQFSVLGDIIHLFAIPVHVMYAFLHQINKFHCSAIAALFRLVRGRKVNVLRKRVDSADWTDGVSITAGFLVFLPVLFLYPAVGVYVFMIYVFHLLALLAQELTGVLAAVTLYYFPLFLFLFCRSIRCGYYLSVPSSTLVSSSSNNTPHIPTPLSPTSGDRELLSKKFDTAEEEEVVDSQFGEVNHCSAFHIRHQTLSHGYALGDYLSVIGREIKAQSTFLRAIPFSSLPPQPSFSTAPPKEKDE